MKLIVVILLAEAATAAPLVSQLRSVASEALELKRRRDDEISALSVAQVMAGMWMCFGSQPLSQVYQMFVTASFYQSLMGRIAGVETDAVAGEPRRVRSRKRLTSLGLIGAAYVGSKHLPVPSLALGAAASRSAIAVADETAAVAAKEVAVLRATRAIVNDEGNDEYVDAARQAVRKAVEQKTITKSAPPATRALVALLATLAAVRIVSTQRLEFDVFAPCVVGSFQAARGGRRFLATNRFFFRMAEAKFVARVFVHLQRPLLFLLQVTFRIADAVGQFLATSVTRVVRASERSQKFLFGNEYFLVDLVHKSPFVFLKKCIGTVWRLRQFPTTVAQKWASLIQKIQGAVKKFLAENHDALWPWVVAMAGYKVQTKAISLFPGVPRYLGEMAALPTVTIAKVAARLVDTARKVVLLKKR